MREYSEIFQKSKSKKSNSKKSENLNYKLSSIIYYKFILNFIQRKINENCLIIV